MTEITLTVEDLSITVIRKKIKNLRFAVYPPNGAVRVSAPKRMSDENIRLAVHSKLNWLQRSIKTLQARPKAITKNLVSGETHYFLGQPHILTICHTEKRPTVKLGPNQTLQLHIDQQASVEKRQHTLSNWYRKEIKKILPNLIEKWEVKLGLKVQTWGVKRMKTRWGSCIPAHRRIWLNLELIQKPIECLEYVVVHEMVHFLEHTHNAVFQKHMENALPNWRDLESQLNPKRLAE